MFFRVFHVPSIASPSLLFMIITGKSSLPILTPLPIAKKKRGMFMGTGGDREKGESISIPFAFSLLLDRATSFTLDVGHVHSSFSSFLSPFPAHP